MRIGVVVLCFGGCINEEVVFDFFWVVDLRFRKGPTRVDFLQSSETQARADESKR